MGHVADEIACIGSNLDSMLNALAVGVSEISVDSVSMHTF